MTWVVKAPTGGKLSVESLGDPEGKPVFLLHGTPGSRNGPRPRGVVLHRRGIRLISYDRPGYPGSDRQPKRQVVDAAADVEAIADYFGIERFSIIGRSGGGPHALACAARLYSRVICAAALSSLAPYDAEDFNWTAGMVDSNVRAYSDDENVVIAQLEDKAGQVKRNSDGLLRLLWPDLVGHDKEVIGDIALRQLIAQIHVEALRDTADGWIDDVIALRTPWGFDPADIKVPVKLWAGRDDAFSPASHTEWLERRINKAEVEIESGRAHFGAVEILPRILTWVTQKMNEELWSGKLTQLGSESTLSDLALGASVSDRCPVAFGSESAHHSEVAEWSARPPEGSSAAVGNLSR